MRLYLLGRLDLHDGAHRRMDAVLARPKSCALLAYLALGESDAPIRRDTLYGIFWPECTQEQARHALSQALYRLRHALGANVLVAGPGGQVGLATGALWCDAAELSAALAAGRDREALELYRGELMPGFFFGGDHGFETWLATRREQFRRGIAAALSRLIASAEREGQLDVAIAHAYRAGELLPYDEAAVRRLIVLLAAAGDRVGAVAVYEAFAARLAIDLHMTPSAGAAELIASIRSAALRVASVPAAPADPAAIAMVERHDAAPSMLSLPRPVTAAARLIRPPLSPLLAVLIAGVALVALVVGQMRHPLRVAAPSYTEAAALSRLGRSLADERTPARLAIAVEQFEAAIRADSAYAPAYSGLADAYTLLAWYGRSDRRVTGPAARRAALRAVALDGDLAAAHTSLGAVYAWVDDDALQAAREYRLALRLDPRYAAAHDWYALLLAARGYTDSAMFHARLALALDSTSRAIGADLATVLLWAGRNDEAVAQWRHTIQRDASFERGHQQLWMTYALAGRWNAALDELDELLRLEGAPVTEHSALHRAYARNGSRGIIEWRLRAVSDSSHAGGPRPLEAAMLCVLLQRPEPALAWIRRARDSGNPYLRFAALDPGLAPLRNDRRFLALIPARMPSAR